MFTGLITDIGRLVSVKSSKIFNARISCNYNYDETSEGASICHDGVCLTIFNKRKEEKGFSYEVEISNETISKSNIIKSKTPWQIGKKINLEKSLKIGDELGGHIVTGHVDGIAKLIKSEKIDESHKLTFECSEKHIKFIAIKGSIALNGTSLTVNNVSGNLFTVNIIPHTKQVTTWKDSKTGDQFNLEIDLLARYLDRLQSTRD